MGKKFVLEFDMGGEELSDRCGGMIEAYATLRLVADSLVSGAHLLGSGAYDVQLGMREIRDSNGNTIGHFEIVETDESEG